MQDKDRKKNTPDQETKDIFPAIALRGLVAFPHMVMELEIGRKESQRAVDEVSKAGSDRQIVLVAQKDHNDVNPGARGIYRVGTLCMLRQVVRSKDGLHIIAEGLTRVRIRKHLPSKEGEARHVLVRALPELTEPKTPAEKKMMKALIRLTKEEFFRWCKMTHRVPRELAEMILGCEEWETLADGILANADFPYAMRQSILEENDATNRMNLLYQALTTENELVSTEMELQASVQSRIDQGQREMFLREQQRLISEELGETGDDTSQYAERIEALDADDDVKAKLRRELQQLNRMPMASQEAYVISNYLDAVLSLPWGTYTEEKHDILAAQEQLDADHYGLKRVKQRILEAMSVHALGHALSGQIICLVGPPGVGKTSVAKSVAAAMGRNFARVSLGGIRDEAEIRGHRKTYVAAMPGRIMDAVKRAGSANPLILLDEIDKLSGDYKGDPAAALLEVLDSAQNHSFRDHFLEVPFDLSRVLFLTTANDAGMIPAPLYDRMDVIELNSYTREEKFHIAKEHLIRKQLEANGLKETQFQITDEAVYDLIDYYTREAGVRSLERAIGSLCRKCAHEILTKRVRKVQYTPETLLTALGPHKALPDFRAEEDSVGVANGLAWTAVGGTVMPIEVLTLPGKGDITVTGSLGDVMQESVKIGLSYVRSVAKQYDINPELFKTRDIHVHAPEGAVKKDGPSAGVTVVTALVSALSGIPVRHDIAMTGEITLHGKVLPIGGLTEKTMAAYKNNIRTVLIPAGNEPDLAEIDETVRDAVHFIPCETLETVLESALNRPHYDTKLEPLHPDEAALIALSPVPERRRGRVRKS